MKFKKKLNKALILFRSISLKKPTTVSTFEIIALIKEDIRV